MLGKPAEAISWLEQAGAGLGEATLAEPTLGWQEWRQVQLMAATELTGDHEGAKRQYAAYRAVRPNRTVWRLGSYETRAQAAVPGRAAYMAALKAAGMPEYANEDEDFGVPATSTPQDGGDFDATPLIIPGAKRINTASLRALLGRAPRPLILDCGHGTAVIPGAVWVWQDGVGDRDLAVNWALSRAKPSRGDTIVVAGDGPTGWLSYDAALHIVAQGFHSVLWYRGGNEAWASAGYPAEDRRPH
jgi:hypothetical protein